MHLARIEHTDDEEAYGVSFVKHNPDGSYCWPDPEDKSSVDRCDMVNLKPPAEDIISGAGSVVRVKLIFDKSDLEASIKLLNVPLKNIT